MSQFQCSFALPAIANTACIFLACVRVKSSSAMRIPPAKRPVQMEVKAC